MSETTTEAVPDITWETKVRGWHGKHRGTVSFHGLQFRAMVDLTPQWESGAGQWTADCRLTGGGITQRASFSGASWQAARAWAQRQARAWCAEHGKGGAE